MKPLSITIEGIKSFIEPQTADFTLVGKNNIFVIGGVTGAGKTTVLDCIILALYGGIKGNGLRSDDYINLKVNKGSVTLFFEAEKNGVTTTYCVTRTFYRGSRGAKAVLSSEGGAVICEGADKVNAEIENIIGLDFDDFTKVVVLQQGKYSEFLKATAGRRTELVGSLFKLEKYRNLFQKARAEKDKEDAVLSALDEYLQEKRELTAAALGQKKKELRRLEKQERQTDALIAELKKECEELKMKRRGYEEYEKALKLQETAKAEFERADAALSALKRTDISESEKTLAFLTERLGAAQQNLKRISESRTLFLAVKSTEEQIEEKRRQYKKTAAEKDEANAKADLSQKKIAVLRERITLQSDTLSESGPDLFATEINSAGAYRLLGELKLSKSEADTADGKVLSAKAEKEKREKAARRAEEKLRECEKACEKADAAEKKASEDAEKARTEFESAKEGNAAQAIAARLKEGDLCPVCGNRVGELCLQGGGDFAEAERIKRDAESAERAAKDNAAALRSRRAAALAEYESAKALLKESEDALSQAESAAGKAKRVRGGFDIAIAAAAAIAADAESAESEQKNCDEYRSLALRLEEKLAGLKSEGMTLKRTLSSLQEQLSGISGDFAEAEDRAKAEFEKIRREREELDRRIKRYRTDLRAAEANHAGTLGIYRTRTENTEKLKCEKVDEKELALKEEELGGAEKERAKIVAEKSMLSLQTASEEKELAVKREKEEQRKKTAARIANLEILLKMFKGDKFVEFIAQEYIEDFSAEASQILSRTSGGCYTMGYDADKAEFYVCDFRADNMRRSTSTLSGGETFLASLALAIAVSKAIAAKNTSGLKFDFLFLDEGFGTLHKDAIGVVERALRLLSKETLVGIVTHRSELSELIPDKLIVESATEREGSKLKILS